MNERIRRLSDRSEFFLVITISFAYFIGTSLWVLVARIRDVELTTGRALRGIAIEVGILLLVGWILRARGWSMERLTGRFSWVAFPTGFLLFVAYYFLYVTVTMVAMALFRPAASLQTSRIVPSASLGVLLVFILVNSVFEETLVTGYVVSALSEQGAALAITASTLLRFLYHLYQGPVASVAILPLGILFAVVYWRGRALWPLFVAHTIANLFAAASSSRG